MHLRIAHVDMDAFFASVEERADPRLKGQPLLVGGGPPRREVVTTASYAARKYGIRSGMSLREAFQRCPEARFRPVDPPRYVAAFEALLAIFESFTPLVEPASIDEAFLDFSGFDLTENGCMEMARGIQSRIHEAEHLTCSIGLGPSKLQAKMASGIHKPGGLTPLLPGDFPRLFWDRPCGDLWGVGPRTTRLLDQSGIRTIGEIAHAPVSLLEGLLGIHGRVLRKMAHGEGGGPVVPRNRETPARSMGHEVTLVRAESQTRVLEMQLLLLCDRLSRRLRRERDSGHTIRLKLKWEDGSSITRQTSRPTPTDDERVILNCARNLLREVHGGRPVRLLGVTVDQLVRDGAPLPLLAEDVRRRAVIEAMDRLRNRFGEASLIPAGVLPLVSMDEVRADGSPPVVEPRAKTRPG